MTKKIEKPKKCKLTKAQRAWATCTQTLIKQAPLSLTKRCQLIKQRFKQDIHRTTLRNYYRRSNITYRQPLRSLQTTMSPEVLRDEWLNFIQYLLQRMWAGKVIYFFDETSTCLWEKLGR